MAKERTVLITGTAGFWGKRVAAHLLEQGGYRVLGLDVQPPAREMAGLDFVQADVRNSLLVDLLKDEGVGIVCHLAGGAGPEVYVAGTIHLLEACGQGGVEKVVLKSSTAVYGARPTNPAFLREDHSLRGSRRWDHTRGLIEVERFCQGFDHHVPGTMLTILRFANIVGPRVDSPLARFLRQPWAPGLLGFDPMMQVIHEEDVVEALGQAIARDVAGVFNVAAREALPLNRMRALAGRGRLDMAHPLAYLATRLGRGERLPLEPDYMRYPWVGDLARMEGVLSFEPRYGAEEAIQHLANGQRGAPQTLDGARMAREEARLRATLALRRRRREGDGNG